MDHSDDEGVVPTDDDGVDHSDDEGVVPSDNIEGVVPTEDEGVVPCDSEGVVPRDVAGVDIFFLGYIGNSRPGFN